MQTDYPCIRFLASTPLKPDYPLFIFLPSMDGSDLSLHNQLEGLATEFDLRCLWIPADDRSNWDGLVVQVAQLVQAERQANVHRPVYLCGESFGGCLALKLVVHSPHLFDRLVLVNPASSFQFETWKCWSSVVVGQMSTTLYALATIGLLPFLVALNRISDQNRDALLQAMRSVPPKSVAWRISLLCNFRLPEKLLKQVTQPVLIIASAADQLFSSCSEAKRLAHFLPNARQVTLPQSGHACLLEADVHLDQILGRANFLAKSTSLVG